MDEYKPITGELRELLADVNWAEITGHMRLDHGAILDGDWLDSWHAAVGHACDNIDSVHAQLERDYARVKAERDSMAAALDAAQGEHAYAPESHYMMLPKDADGVPIHVGDVMEWATGEMFEVVGIGDGGTLYYAEDGQVEWTNAERKRHYTHTVEDVLTEFGIDWEHESDCEDRAALLKEYAAKLRLAGEK